MSKKGLSKQKDWTVPHIQASMILACLKATYSYNCAGQECIHIFNQCAWFVPWWQLFASTGGCSVIVPRLICFAATAAAKHFISLTVALMAKKNQRVRCIDSDMKWAELPQWRSRYIGVLQWPNENFFHIQFSSRESPLRQIFYFFVDVLQP